LDRAVTRAFDLVVATVALVVLAPVLAVVAIAVRAALGRPVLFRQERPGLNGRPFVLVKFRTMRDACDSAGAPLSDAERLTPFGRFLRSTSLDELPELYNVVRGEMSIVGPRPLLMCYLDRYSPAQMGRHDVKPGLTGWCQVNGRNDLDWDTKLSLDLWYVENKSLALDVKIVISTVGKILSREGTTRRGWATTEEFQGAGEPAG
jgi:sugar transferase EpsL